MELCVLNKWEMSLRKIRDVTNWQILCDEDVEAPSGYCYFSSLTP